MSARGGHYLSVFLAPLRPFLERPDVTDIYINRPKEVWCEHLGGLIERHDVGDLTADVITRLARQIASFSAQGISREQPLLAANLPDGARVQIVLPPATRSEVAIAIRKHSASNLDLRAYAAEIDVSSTGSRSIAGEFEFVSIGAGRTAIEKLCQAASFKRTILISGGTSTGKTTFLNGLLREVPSHERLIVIEDTPELAIGHPNAVGLVAARGTTSEARIDMEDLLIASLRMRPDRIILGEIRGSEAQTFLRAANTGHPGSMSSIHADSPQGAIDQLALLVVQSGSAMAWDNVVDYISRSLDVIVQLERFGGTRRIADIQVKPTIMPWMFPELVAADA